MNKCHHFQVTAKVNTPGAVKIQRCMVSISELHEQLPADSLIYHAYISMFFIRLQIR